MSLTCSPVSFKHKVNSCLQLGIRSSHQVTGRAIGNRRDTAAGTITILSNLRRESEVVQKVIFYFVLINHVMYLWIVDHVGEYVIIIGFIKVMLVFVCVVCYCNYSLYSNIFIIITISQD
jgi:hypothetical protein